MPRPEDTLVGQRLRDVRTHAGLSQAQVAAALDIPRSAVSLIESGERSLASTELAKLAQIFRWSVDDLLFGRADEDSEQIAGEGVVLQYFRASGTLDPASESWLSEAQELWRRYAAVESLVFGTQRWELPTYPVPPGAAYEQGERLAEHERRRLGLGPAPIRSMVDLLEGEGIKVLFLPFEANSEASGGYFFSAELGPCVVINQDELASRRRFTEAHEYCHFLVDREQIEGEICGQSRRREHFEMRANAFGAAFLMPTEGIDEALMDDGVDRGDELGPENVVHLMYRFGVSYQAILWRLLNLHWISAAERTRLASVSPTVVAEQLGYEIEPGQAETKPNRQRRLAFDAWRSGNLSDKEVAELVGIPVRDVKQIFGHAPAAARRHKRRPVEDPDWL